MTAELFRKLRAASSDIPAGAVDAWWQLRVNVTLLEKCIDEERKAIVWARVNEAFERLES